MQVLGRKIQEELASWTHICVLIQNPSLPFFFFFSFFFFRSVFGWGSVAVAETIGELFRTFTSSFIFIYVNVDRKTHEES